MGGKLERRTEEARSGYRPVEIKKGGKLTEESIDLDASSSYIAFFLKSGC